MKPVYLVVGVPGSGKSWACRQVEDKFTYVPHDLCWTHPTASPEFNKIDPDWGPPGSESIHLEVLLKMSVMSSKPIITEVPFAERPLREALEKKGIQVIPIFVIEDPEIVAQRYEQREGKPLPKSAFSRASSIIDRAREWGGFHGTSKQVLEHLRCV